jgi:hypothetical protein
VQARRFVRKRNAAAFSVDDRRRSEALERQVKPQLRVELGAVWAGWAVTPRGCAQVLMGDKHASHTLTPEVILTQMTVRAAGSYRTAVLMKALLSHETASPAGRGGNGGVPAPRVQQIPQLVRQTVVSNAVVGWPLTRGFGPLTRGAPRRLEEACTDVQRELAAEKERTATPLLGPLRRFDGADALSGGKLLDEAVPTPASKLHWLLTDAASPMLPQLADTLRWRQLTVPPFHHGHRQVRRHSTASSRVRAAERRR